MLATECLVVVARISTHLCPPTRSRLFHPSESALPLCALQTQDWLVEKLVPLYGAADEDELIDAKGVDIDLQKIFEASDPKAEMVREASAKGRGGARLFAHPHQWRARAPPPPRPIQFLTTQRLFAHPLQSPRHNDSTHVR